MEKGDHFGERSLLLESTRTMDVISKSKCVCYSISVETLKNMVGEKYRDILYLNFIKMSFSISQYFNKINLKLLESAYECFHAVNLGKNQVAYPKGHINTSKFTIIIEGSLKNVYII